MEHVQESGGIRTARTGYQHRVHALEEAALADRAPYSFE
jgi:hypothetical protein